jgi:MinD-like ATPase involved in chromosome partitioning or flagellar assembly
MTDPTAPVGPDAPTPHVTTIDPERADGPIAAAPVTHVPTAAPVTDVRVTVVPVPAGPAPTPSSEPAPALPAAPDAATLARWVRPAAARRTRRESFLTQEPVEEPATTGVRGALRRVGIRVAPSAGERAERDDVRAVSQHWAGPRTIAIANGKGGAGKTPTSILLSAVFARHGGAGVLVWDHNQTRGTLGWRTERGAHDATLLDLLPEAERLLGTGAQSADLARFVHHQTQDRFDVLRSKPVVLADEQRLEPEDVDLIHAVATKYYRLVLMDSGNDESDPMWKSMIRHADQLVVATTTRGDHAASGALLLETLPEAGGHSAALAANAVVVVSQADPKAPRADVARVVDGYRGIARAAVAVPYDPAMVDGVLRHGALSPATQRAWLAAGAAVARGL